MKRIELAILQCSQAPSVASPTIQVSGNRIRDQLPPFVVGEDMAKYLVKFEHVCERNALERSLWAQNLLALLPGEVSDAITCLSREAFESYDEVKEVLLRRYKLSPEAFRQRFRYAEKGNESHVDFAFRLKADLIEWLKGEGVYDDRDKVVECVALEQFYRCIEEDVKLWLQDRLGDVQLNKAAELAEEYYTRRKLHSRAVRVEKDERKEGFSRKPDQRKPVPHRNFKKDPSLTKDSVGEGQTEAEKSSEVSTTQAFESENKRKPLICYNCKKEGHIARNCQEKFAFATIRESEKTFGCWSRISKKLGSMRKRAEHLETQRQPWTLSILHWCLRMTSQENARGSGRSPRSRVFAYQSPPLSLKARSVSFAPKRLCLPR
uniref:Putative tick transposon n=1 Tax=Rhipicephalus microplus TaxID=6941 RepID=A0A6G5ACN5_RHIMP